MTDIQTSEHPCDVCGSDDAVEIPAISEYQPDQPVHVCKDCGFVYVRRRRSAEEIARSWSEDIFEGTYTARIPAVRARHVYVAEFLASTIGLEGKNLCDIGGGEGQFLELVRGDDYGAKVFAIEPSAQNCESLRQNGIDAFEGTIEDFLNDPEASKRQFDIVTIMWTLENCNSCRTMVDAAYKILRPGGHLLVATGSRILVPFKKPLQYYVGNDKWGDTHPFRFSANSLRGLLAGSGFATEHINRYFDTDYLTVVAQKTDGTKVIPRERDDYLEVLDFFDRWHVETRDHLAHF